MGYLSAIVYLLLAYVVVGAVYRLFFAHAAGIPGPKLAALTLWYEYYYDVVKRGRYEFEIAKMHDRYGPIVRINPYEIHIADPEFYDTLYTTAGSSSRKLDKWPFAARLLGNELSMFGTIPHDHHRLRRSALNPFFSKRSISQLEPLLYSHVDKVVAKIHDAKAKGTVANLSDVFAAFSGDVIMDYTFGSTLNLLEDEEGLKDWRTLWVALCESGALIKQFTIVAKIQRAIPPAITQWMDPRFRLIHSLVSMLVARVTEMKESISHPSESQKPLSTNLQSTLLHKLLHGPLPEAEKGTERVVHECQALIGAGTTTTAETLSSASYHLIATPEILSKLHAELTPVFQKHASTSKTGRPPLKELQRLPYLTAILKETLRLYYGVTQRLPRINPDADMRYKSYILPRGTPVSMSSMNMHTNTTIFGDDAREFYPDRWLKSPSPSSTAEAETVTVTDPDNESPTISTSPLDKYLVSFGRGPRACLGINLAWAELYLTLAAVFAPDRFGYELFETGVEDVEVKHDFLVPFPRVESLGIRALVS